MFENTDPLPENLEYERRWFARYVESRRARNIPEHGIEFKGEGKVYKPRARAADTAPAVLPENAGKAGFCHVGHPMEGHNVCVAGDGKTRCRRCKNLANQRWMRRTRGTEYENRS